MVEIIHVIDNRYPGGSRQLDIEGWARTEWVEVNNGSHKRRELTNLQGERFHDYLAENGKHQLIPMSTGQSPGVKVESKEKPTEEKKDASTQIVELVTNHTEELFTDEHGTPFAAIDVDGHREIHAIESKQFKRYVSHLFYQEKKKAPGSEAMNNAFNVLAGKAAFEGTKRKLYVRTAWHNGSIFIDCCDEGWRAIEINKEGWHVRESRDYPILFRRYGHMLPIEVTSDERTLIDDVFKFIPITDEGGRAMLKIYLVACWVPDIPSPIPDIHGEQGSGKSTSFKMLRAVIDPSSLELLSFPKDKNELVQLLQHHYCSYFDNVDGLANWQSDTLCRAATGEGVSKRELYTNDDDFIYKFRRRVGLNGINVSAQKPDLLDRSILLRLRRIEKHHRKPEKAILREWSKLLPGLRATMLDTLVKTLSIEPEVKPTALPRMADFAIWGEAVSRALGMNENVFLNHYWANLNAQNEEALEANPVGLAIVQLMANREEWSGSPADLLEVLRGIAEAEKIDVKQKLWPKAPHILTRRITVVETNLRELGIKVYRDRQERRLIEIRKSSDSSGGSDEHAVNARITDYSSDATSAATENSSDEPLQSVTAEDKTIVATDATDATLRISEQIKGFLRTKNGGKGVTKSYLQEKIPEATESVLSYMETVGEIFFPRQDWVMVNDR